MSKEYTISAGGITLANQAVTLVFINPKAAPNVGLKILRAWIAQSANATSAQQRVQLVKQVSAFPTLVSATPKPLNDGDAIASLYAGGTAGAAGTCGINASAEGAGSKTIIWEDAFNVLNGWQWFPSPREVISFPAGSVSGFGLHLPVAAGTLTNWAFGIVFAEE
jgi:hypothetical protein